MRNSLAMENNTDRQTQVSSSKRQGMKVAVYTAYVCAASAAAYMYGASYNVQKANQSAIFWSDANP